MLGIYIMLRNIVIFYTHVILLYYTYSLYPLRCDIFIHDFRTRLLYIVCYEH